MNPDKKWKRYTKVGQIHVNMTKYRQLISPTDNGCLEWQGPKHRQGYGMIGVLDEDGFRRMTVVHRVAMRMKLGREIKTNEDVRHACGNNLCCNPAHLYLRNDENRNDTKAITLPEIPMFAK
jgi:HNH endonuclease